MQQDKKRPWALLGEILPGSRALYIVSAVFMLVTLAAQFLLPQMVRFVVDNVIGGEPAEIAVVAAVIEWAGGAAALRDHLPLVGVVIVLVAVVNGVAAYIHRRTLAMGAEGMVKRLRDRLFSHIQKLPYRWHVDIQTGDIIQRCTSDVDVVRNFLSVQVLEMVRTVVLVVLAYSLLFTMNVPMAAASVLFLPAVFGYSFVFLQKVSDRFQAADETEGQLLAIAQENFTGVRVVRAFGRERHEVDRFDKQNRHFADLWMRLGVLLSSYWGLGDLMTGLQMVTICAMGVLQASRGNLTVGGFIVFLTYNSMTIWPVRGLGRVLSEASKTVVSLGRLRDILDAPPEEDEPDAQESPVDGDIVFRHVSFAYGGHPVLRDVSFTVEKGTTLGILGATGAGKSTLVHLLCRLYDLPEGGGSITIGGVDIRRMPRGWLRRHVGIVLQEPFLFSRTIESNIASLSRLYTAEEIREAARAACVDDAIEQFEKGYDTVVGERGVTLSGGQKQRVAIARTLLQGPPILIFDDSLSAVDTETDAKIRQALGRRTSGITTVIIAHRITSVASADKVLVMDAGRIVEMGTPAQLLAMEGGVYRRIHDLQEIAEEDLEEGVE